MPLSKEKIREYMQLRRKRAEVRYNEVDVIPNSVNQDVIPNGINQTLPEVLALGQRLARSEIAGLLCGITARDCYDCKGIPCFGSVPLDDM